jgi:hypothetical protein
MSLLRFMHIPKTGGSTFGLILRHQYRGKGDFSFSGDIASDIHRFKSLSEHERNNVELFKGHAPISTGLPEADNAMIITFLRDPIDRVKSFCHHVSEGKSPYLRKEFPPESFSLDRFLESGNAELSNLQTKMLINSGSCASPVLLESMSPAEARDMALTNLYGRVSYFGLTEFFDQSLAIFSQSLNWSIPVYVSLNRKHTTGSIEFKERHLSRIAELNSIDIEVYDAARARFMDIAESVEFHNTKLKLFLSINAFLNAFFALGMKIWSSFDE